MSDSQLQKLVDAILSLKVGGFHWDQVVPVFLSALLAMLVGIALDHLKTLNEERRIELKRQRNELQQINGVVAGIAYNIEVLLHAVGQHILPHYEESHAAYDALQEANSDGAKMQTFALNLRRYPALMMTCPEMHFVEFDFLDKLPFLIEKDAELVKKAAWMRGFSRLINAAISDRNKQIESAHQLLMSERGALNFYQLDGSIQLQRSVSETECVTALQLFESFQSIGNSLQSISAGYKNAGKRTTLHLPPALNEIVDRLRKVIGSKILDAPQTS